VGDIFFQQKCHARAEELMAQHQTAIVLVSHDMASIEKHSSQVLLLGEGQSLFYGNPAEAIGRYYSSSRRKLQEPLENVSNSNNIAASSHTESSILEDWPLTECYLDLSSATLVGDSGAAKCTAVALLNLKGQPSTIFEMGETAVFYYEFEILQDIFVPVGGLTILTSKNIPIYAKNSLQYAAKAPLTVSKGNRVRFRHTVKFNLAPGPYTFAVGLGTINSYYYERTEFISHSEIDQNYFEVSSIIPNTGCFNIIPKKNGLSIPFYGYVDLEGDCHLEVSQADS
jgi:ABC-type glutathione transport system ATPase component